MNAPKLLPRTLDDLMSESVAAYHCFLITWETAGDRRQHSIRQHAWMERLDARIARIDQ